MMSYKPSLYVHSTAAPSSYVQATRHERRPTSSYSHISFFRSMLLDMQIYSPSVKVVKQPGSDTTLPAFGDQDRIEGKVLLDPSCQNGRLTITLEGTFEYSSVKESADEEHSRNSTTKKYRHVFLSSSSTIPITFIPDSRSTIREALGVRKRPSLSSLNSPACCSCEFDFELPRGSRPGEEMPSSFSFKAPPEDLQGRYREEFEVAYRIIAVWEGRERSGNRATYVDRTTRDDVRPFSPRLEVPILLQPDIDFQSLDGSATEPESWLEMPLMPERPIPLSCAVTLPRPQSFSRSSFIPYYVVFTTNNKSPTLVKEIASDATIVVSLIRKITITSQCTPRSPTRPDTPPPSDESDGQTSPFALLRRSVKSSSRSHTGNGSGYGKKTPPEVPQTVFCVSRTLLTGIFIGFPKRPRGNDSSGKLPDGLYKGKIQLSKSMLPSMDWPGMSVKYYLDVSVLAGQDDVRARIPIKIC